MNLETYNETSLRTLGRMATMKQDLSHMAMGISGEGGEVSDIIKKHVAYDKPLDRDHLLEEIGDMCFYINGMISMLGSSWDEVLTMNVSKLQARYKGGTFNAKDAINRDKAAEQVAMKFGPADESDSMSLN